MQGQGGWERCRVCIRWLDQSGFVVGGTDISISLLYPGSRRLGVFWRALGIVHDIWSMDACTEVGVGRGVLTCDVIVYAFPILSGKGINKQ